ncbi:MAG: protein kinase, partial [Myxococcales bacterium]|nr:protein kinase [Myxococcales bacterium]
IGAGGMGVVYLAQDPELDRLVALKLLHRTDGDEDARERLLREAKATARLSHPNVVSVYDVGPYEGGSFVALEYVHGGTLRQWLRQPGRSWTEIVQALVHAGHGLAAAHGAGLVHRDFKPDNVLVGADGRVRVVDFGLARPLSVGGDPRALIDVEGQTIQAGNLAGTPGYMAPEQLREGREVDARSDVFAFCITLWEALTGERPFGGATIADHIQHVLRGQLRPFPRDLGVPVTVVDALQRGLAVDPDARWQRIDDLLKVLGSAVGDDDVARSQVRPFDEGTSAAMPSALGVRYRLIEPFAEGALGPIFRAYDRLEGQRVAIKRTYALDLPNTGEVHESPRLALARELRGRFALRHPNLVGIVDFGFDDEDVAFFVLDLAEGARPLLSAAADAPRAIQVHLIGQLLRALIYLHRRGRVGLALSSQNVVVAGESLKVIDTDWYIDSAVSALHETLRPQGPTAPERSKGGEATVAGDLYAVGVLMAALFGGVSTTDSSEQAALLSAAKAGSLERSFAIDGPLAGLIGRLLAPDPAARPASAAEALDRLVEASGIELPAETVHTRESFLQAGALVGREGELEYLVEALRGGLRGRGRAIALGGESGVGKSRLISEVRTLGLVHGAVVLRGHATSEGGRLFDAWRPLLRWLALSSALSDLEASVLRIGVPDIDILLGRAVPSAPELDAASAQLRLLQVVIALLRRQVRPLVVLLEDLHWARSESVELLASLSRELEGLRLLVVASYRDDEAPRLFAEDTGIERRRLGRLDRPAIREVVVATVGATGASEGIVELLVRETEGNALFVVEVLRTLAEDAGGLEGIGAQPLPSTIAAGGIRRVIQRRIARLSRPARELLEVAAVVGRDLDVELLARLAPALDRDALIAEAVDRAALERDGVGWRFSHDKIRESLLEELAEARKRSLHAAVAEAIEADDDRDRAEELAYHFRAIDRPDKELVYVARAGDRSAETIAYRCAGKRVDHSPSRPANDTRVPVSWIEEIVLRRANNYVWRPIVVYVACVRDRRAKMILGCVARHCIEYGTIVPGVEDQRPRGASGRVRIWRSGDNIGSAVPVQIRSDSHGSSKAIP